MKPPVTSTREKGQRAEDIAAEYLVQQGYRILHRNWTSGRNELDIIAENATHLAIIEVKSRFTDQYAEPWEAVNSAKRRRILQSAHTYIRRSDSTREPRFDIISIYMKGDSYTLDHIEGAFQPMA